MSHTIAGFLVESLLDALVERGCDERALRRRAGIPRGRGFRRLPYHQLDDLMEAGLEATGDRNLGLHLCGCVGPEVAPLGLLLLACPDMITGLRRLIQFERLISDVRRMSLETGPEGTWFTVRLPDEDRPAARHVLDWMLGDGRIVTERLLGRWTEPLAVEVRYAAPADPSEHEAWFGAPVRFGAAHNRILLRDEDWHAPVRSASETFRRVFERQVHEAHDALPRRATRAGAVRAIIADRLPSTPTLDEVATAMRISPRSLQRSLGSEGWSLSTVLDAVRKERAEALLGRGEPIGEVAWQLGYSEQSAFQRAFRRWFGVAPGAWRSG